MSRFTRSIQAMMIAATTAVSLLTIAVPSQSIAAAIADDKPRDVAQYNVPKNHLAIDGYDPVSYFPEGGSVAKKGLETITHTHNGITYRFASKAHLDLFKAAPDRYEPAYGGWCAYACGNDGSRVEIDPKSFIVEKGRLFLFYKDIFNNTRASFLEAQAKLTTSADANWKKTVGEDARDVAVPKPASPKPASTTPPASPQASATPLKDQLDEMNTSFRTNAKPETVALYDDGIRQVAESSVITTAAKVGAVAPDFTVNDAKGEKVNLASMLKQGPVVLTWYRGGWCPYCNIQLNAYQQILPDIKAAGGQIVALTPELPDNSLSTAEKNKLEFHVVSDAGNAVAKQYGIAYRLPESLVTAFKGRLDLPKINGDESWTLPLAATYVVAPSGKITYAFVQANYTKRAEPAEILAAVKAASASR